jgi:DNA-directed RNA polymerase subunit RPC12/RpoP
VKPEVKPERCPYCGAPAKWGKPKPLRQLSMLIGDVRATAELTCAYCKHKALLLLGGKP